MCLFAYSKPVPHEDKSSTFKISNLFPEPSDDTSTSGNDFICFDLAAENEMRRGKFTQQFDDFTDGKTYTCVSTNNTFCFVLLWSCLANSI